MEKDDVMNSREAAQLLGYTLATFHRRLKAGELPLKPITPIDPKLKRPKKLLFARQDVEALLKPPQS